MIKGFSDPRNPKVLSRIGIPLSPKYDGPIRPPGFMPSASSLVFHPVEMVIAASGFDQTGTVKLFKCPTPKGPETWDQAR